MISQRSTEFDVDLTPSEFRTAAHKVIDWIVEYQSHPDRFAVLPDVRPGEVMCKLPREAPERPESLDDVLRDLDEVIVPGLTHWNHPGFMAYFAITASAPGILGELLAAALNSNGMLWRTAPAAVELEEVVLGWLRRMLGLPEEFSGLIHDTASTSSLVALIAARESIGMNIRQQGMSARPELPRLRVYVSEHAHSSIEKAAVVIGIGQDGVRKIAPDDQFRMNVVELESAIREDVAGGIRPLAVVATVGTTSTTSVDPVPAIAEVCQRENIWLHVDAAYAGNAAVLPEYRWLLDGCQRADSLVVNPHKWLFVPIDCSILYCRKPEVLRNAFSLVPEYLASREEEAERNPMDYGIALGRRFRALKLWMVMRMFGQEGIRQRLRGHIALAHEFMTWVAESPDFELVAPAPLSVVCFRFHPKNATLSSNELDELNARLLERVNASGEVFLSHTKLNDAFVIRLAVGNLRTERRHVLKAWELLNEAGQALWRSRELERKISRSSD